MFIEFTTDENKSLWLQTNEVESFEEYYTTSANTVLCFINMKSGTGHTVKADLTTLHSKIITDATRGEE